MPNTETTTDWAAWRGHEVLDAEGAKIGKVEEIYVDEETARPEWLAVKTGLFGGKHSFIPLAGATTEGDTIRVAHTKDRVSGSPRAEQDKDGVLTPQEEAELYRYYGRGETAAPAAERQAPANGRDTSGPNTDDAMTRSEEQLQVQTATQESGRARLRKYIETEHVTQTVPTRHETVRVETEPITEANAGRAMDGPELSEEEHEIVLHDEQAVAQKQVVPQERVRMVKEETVEPQQVEADLAKERIVTEGDVPASRR